MRPRERAATRLVVLMFAVALAATASAMSGEVGKLTFHGELRWQGRSIDCPPGTPGSAICREHRGSGVIPGLGDVSEQYVFFNQDGTAACPGSLAVIGLKGTFTVGTKGTIEFESGASPDCMPQEQRVTLHFPSVTITGGSGIYAGASGTAMLTKLLNPGSIGAFGSDTWNGMLIVAGLSFDTTAPVLRGVTARTVLARRGAKLVRVLYRVSATDETDGAVPVSCLPRTGSRFKLGRTVVTCAATDKSGNMSRARFTVNVRARR